MPLERCSKDGKAGIRWGKTGACYTGKDGKKKALKQGVAIELNRQKRGEPSEFEKAAKAYLQELVSRKEWVEAADFCYSNASIREVLGKLGK